MARWRPLVVGGALLLTTACGSAPVTLQEGPREYIAEDYEVIRRKWTREKQLTPFEELDNVLTVTATFESWDFRWAYVVRYAEDYRLKLEQRRALLERSLAETRETHTFYLALYAQSHQWSDLTARKPAWVVRLIDDQGTETAPTDIEKMRRPSALEQTYFPYTSPWRVAFRVRFPTTRKDGAPTISKDARWFGLRFAGPQGNEQLVWELAR